MLAVSQRERRSDPVTAKPQRNATRHARAREGDLRGGVQGRRREGHESDSHVRVGTSWRGCTHGRRGLRCASLAPRFGAPTAARHLQPRHPLLCPQPAPRLAASTRLGCGAGSSRLQIGPGGTAATSQPVIAKQTRLKYWIGLNRDKIYAFAANLFVQLYLKALD